jgi:hypothetical protein
MYFIKEKIIGSLNPTPSPLAGEGGGEGFLISRTPHPSLLPQGEKGHERRI